MKLKSAARKYVRRLQKRKLSDDHVSTVAARLAPFVKEHGNRAISTVTRQEIGEYFVKLKKAGLAWGTMAGFSSTHRAFWRFCKRKGWTKKNLGKHIEEYSYEPVVRRPAPEEDVQKVLASLPAFVEHRDRRPRDVRDALLVSLSIDCGGRLGAMWGLTWAEVNRALARGQSTTNGRVVYEVVTHTNKTGSTTLRFCAETAELFRLYARLAPPSEWVFASLVTGKPMRRNSLGRVFERVCRFAGVPVFRSQAVRKRNVTDIIGDIADPETAQRYAGHSDLETTLTFYKEKRREEVHDATTELAARRRDDDFRRGMSEFFSVPSEPDP